MEFAHVLVVVCYFFVYGAYLFIQLLHFFVGAHTGNISSVCIAGVATAKVVDMFFGLLISVCPSEHQKLPTRLWIVTPHVATVLSYPVFCHTTDIAFRHYKRPV